MPSRSTTSPLSSTEARVRLAEARVYLEVAELLANDDRGAARKASSSNAVLAGIAASDAICGIVLGRRSSNDDHAAAVDLLREATSPLTKPATSLRRLLADKTPVQYGVGRVSLSDAAALVRYAQDLVAEADRRAV